MSFTQREPSGRLRRAASMLMMGLLMAMVCLGMTAQCRADYMYQVTVTVSGAPINGSLDFQMQDQNSVTNSATFSNFTNVTPTDVLRDANTNAPAPNGDISTAVTVSDGDYVYQDATIGSPGSTVTFDVTVTDNTDSSGNYDTVQFGSFDYDDNQYYFPLAEFNTDGTYNAFSQGPYTVTITQISTAPVPEPTTILMFTLGLPAAGAALRRRRKILADSEPPDSVDPANLPEQSTTVTAV